jgi:hypothetical protein
MILKKANIIITRILNITISEREKVNVQQFFMLTNTSFLKVQLVKFNKNTM